MMTVEFYWLRIWRNFIERSISNFLPNNAALNGLYPIVVSKSFNITTRRDAY